MKFFGWRGGRKLIKRILFDKLIPGMFVHAFHTTDDHPFFSRSRKIREAREIVFIGEHNITEVDIDTDRGLDIVETVVLESVRQEGREACPEKRAPPIKTFQQTFQREPLNRELVRAQKAKSKARKLVGNILNDVRLGKQAHLGQVRDAIVDMTDSMFRNPDAMLTLGLLKDKDEYTFMHSVNVSVFLISFCQSMDICGDDIIEVGTGAILHDIGKMKVPQDILHKPGSLTGEEFAKIKEHVIFAEQVLSDAPEISQVSMEVVSQHHERMDGTGYPRGLANDQISLYGQMGAVVDVYDAITSKRCYHEAMTAHSALQKMMKWTGAHFNPDLFQKFVRSIGIYPIGTLVRLENSLLAVVIEPNREKPLYPIVIVIFDIIKRRKLTPRRVDLMERSKRDPGFRIKGQEAADQWRINPARFIPRPKQSA